MAAWKPIIRGYVRVFSRPFRGATLQAAKRFLLLKGILDPSGVFCLAFPESEIVWSARNAAKRAKAGERTR